MYNKMVKILIKLNEHEDQVLNIIKAKHNLKNKSEAVSLILREYNKNKLDK